MKAFKAHFRFTALALSFIFSNTAFAAQPATDVSNKDSGTTGSVSNTIEAQPEATVSKKPQAEKTAPVSDAENYRNEMDERLRQVQQAQQEAYKRHIERRKQYLAGRPDAAVFDRQDINSNVPAHIQERRREFIKQMEERRSMHVKMMEQSRKDAEERKAMMLKTHQTDTPESVKKM